MPFFLCKGELFCYIGLVVLLLIEWLWETLCLEYSGFGKKNPRIFLAFSTTFLLIFQGSCYTIYRSIMPWFFVLWLGAYGSKNQGESQCFVSKISILRITCMSGPGLGFVTTEMNTKQSAHQLQMNMVEEAKHQVLWEYGGGGSCICPWWSRKLHDADAIGYRERDGEGTLQTWVEARTWH